MPTDERPEETTAVLLGRLALMVEEYARMIGVLICQVRALMAVVPEEKRPHLHRLIAECEANLLSGSLDARIRQMLAEPSKPPDAGPSDP